MCLKETICLPGQIQRRQTYWSGKLMKDLSLHIYIYIRIFLLLLFISFDFERELGDSWL